MLCLDNRQRTGQQAGLSRIFCEDQHTVEYQLLRSRPVDHPLPATPPTAPLEFLPSLVKRRICSFLAVVDLEDLLCAVLAVPHLAADGQVVLNSHMSWAGKRIIMLANDAEDVPQNLLITDEEDWLLDREQASGYVPDIYEFDTLKKVAMSETYPRAHRFAAACLQSRSSMQSHISIEDLLRPSVSQLENAVLRNLTLKQYYRSNSKAPSWRCYHCNGFEERQETEDNTNFGLGHVALIMTCWADIRADCETLTNRDYVRRDDQSQSTYHYIA
ncbi:hypothetical protein IWQ56_000710 [Coemansia nantahalensis]|nr:hypothetical protein IWQ56_000710 [Coemansia nantahalensis]